jgi:hypothetical protein
MLCFTREMLSQAPVCFEAYRSWIDMLTYLFVDWTQEEAEVPGDNTHLWEESWDDDDTSEDFSAQLK